MSFHLILGAGGEAKKMLRTQQSGKNKLSDALKAL